MEQFETIQNPQIRHAGMFKPGVSGNPSGRPKVDVTIRELAKTHTEDAIHTLAEIMKNPKASASTRVNAACALLDRAWGKPTQQINSVSVGVTYQDYLNQLAIEDDGEIDKPIDIFSGVSVSKA